MLGRDVALGFGHEFIADEEFADGGTAEERRVEVDVEVTGFDFVGSAGERSLVETHAWFGG